MGVMLTIDESFFGTISTQSSSLTRRLRPEPCCRGSNEEDHCIGGCRGSAHRTHTSHSDGAQRNPRHIGLTPRCRVLQLHRAAPRRLYAGTTSRRSSIGGTSALACASLVCASRVETPSCCTFCSIHCKQKTHIIISITNYIHLY